jgi:hypothetical protein
MAKNLPSDFTDKILAKDRISFGDVRRLKRDILPDGIASREEAEALLGLDRAVTKADAAWERWLVTTIVDFVVWAERPTGIVDEDTALWLAAALRAHAGTRAGKRGRLIAREIAEEAHAFENDALATLAGIGASSPRPRRNREPATEPALAAQL